MLFSHIVFGVGENVIFTQLTHTFLFKQNLMVFVLQNNFFAHIALHRILGEKKIPFKIFTIV